MNRLTVFLFVSVMFFLAACSAGSMQQQVESLDTSRLFIAMSGGAAEYSETFFDGGSAALADLARTECPRLGKTFYRAVLESEAGALVLYLDENGTRVPCSILKPAGNGSIEYLSRADAPSEGVALSVNGVPITMQQVQLQLAALPQEIPRDETALGQVLNTMINTELLRQAGEGIELSSGEIDVAREDLLAQANLSKEEFLALLAERNVSEDSFDEMVREQARFDSLLRQRLLLDELEVQESELKEIYLADPNRFLQSEMAVMRHIYISGEGRSPGEVRARVQEALSQVDDADFCDLVQRYSDDDADPCGVYVIPQGVISPDLEYAGFNTPPNQTSVVSTEEGTHIVQTLQVIPSQVIPYSRVSGNLRASVIDSEFQRRLSMYLLLLRGKADIRVYLS